MAHVSYGVWRTLERTQTHLSKAFPFRKHPILSTHSNRIHPQNVASSPRCTEWMFEYIKEVSLILRFGKMIDWYYHCLLPSAIGGMTLSLAYGLQIQQTNDPFINLAETAAKSISAVASFGTFLVDVIPILKYVPEFVPGAGFQKKARIWRKLQEDFREVPYSSSIEAMVRLLLILMHISSFMNDFSLKNCFCFTYYYC